MLVERKQEDEYMKFMANIRWILVISALSLPANVGCDTDFRQTIVEHLVEGLEVVVDGFIGDLKYLVLPDNSSSSTDASE